MTKFTLVVNAGGASSRMQGMHKALLPIPPSGKPLLSLVIETMAPVSTAGIVVVANEESVRSVAIASEQAPITVVPDRWQDAGAMAGIATALGYCSEWAIVVACDMPFLSPVLFDAFCNLAAERDEHGDRQWNAVVPLVRAYPQMLHTLYHVDLLPNLEGLIRAGDLKLLNILTQARVRYVHEEEMAPLDPDLRSFTNVNTADEWADALQALQKEKDSPK